MNTLYDILLRAQAQHLCDLSKTPNDFRFGAETFLDYLTEHDGEYACIDDLLGAVDLDIHDNVCHSEGVIWPSGCIAPAFLQVMEAEYV